jgi:hypothetical protein
MCLFGLAVALAAVLMVVEFARSAASSPLPSSDSPLWERVTIVASALSMVWAGLLHGYLEKCAFREHVESYRRMHNVFQQYRRILESGLDVHAMERAFRDLGKAALGESSEWVRLHRWRPLEPPRG